MVAFAIVYGREYIPNIDFITRAIRERFQDIAPKEEAIRIAGVSIDELADFLWSGNTIGRKQLMDSFALSRSKSDAILEALEGASILVRGKNNARVISDNALRSDIIHTLSPLKTSEE